MIDQEKTNFEYIVKNKNLLLYGIENLNHLDSVFCLFNNKINHDITPHSIEMLNNIISENNIDVIILSSNENDLKIYEVLFGIVKYEEIYIFVCQNNNNNHCDELINISNSTFTQNITPELFCHKLYVSMPNRILSVDKKNDLEETYVDSFELEIIFIRDELLFISKKLDSGDISKNILQRIIQSINRINRIFENYLIYSQKIKTSMKYFEMILKDFRDREISSSNLASYEYLARIVEDVAVFLDNYFIKRNFTNLYIVEDSLENSLKFFKDSYEQKEKNTDNSSLEFFDD